MINHVETGCLLPFFQSLITGVLVGLIAAGAATWMELTNPWMLGLIIGAVGAFWWWVSSIHLWRRDTYHIPDYLLPEPEPVQATSSQPIIINMDRQQTIFADLPAEREDLRQLAEGLLSGVPFAEDSWIGQYKPFSKSQFRAVRDEMIARKLARWVNPNARAQGVALTREGYELCKKLTDG